MTRALLVCIALAACGDDGGGDQQSDAAQAQPLKCNSIAFCTTYDVKTFLGTVPAPAGGVVKDGLYRLAYVIAPSNRPSSAGYHDDVDVLLVQGKYFNWAGFSRDSIGTISTADTTITFTDTQLCDLGKDGSSSTSKLDYKYTAMGNELHLFSHITSSDGTEWDELNVYKASPAEDVCKTYSEPAQPGDSATCRVTNCACRFAASGTVNACT